MSLCGLLKAALGDADEQDPFAVVLKERLKNRGTELLDQVGIRNPRSPCTDLRLTLGKIAQVAGSEGPSSTTSGTKKVTSDGQQNCFFSADLTPKSQDVMNGRG